jgi:predicted 2-oxoglutarate/Fe(II)-dependent dioxygenase YbiX
MYKFVSKQLNPRRLMPLNMELPVYSRVIATLDDVLPAAEFSFQNALQSKLRISSVYSRVAAGKFEGLATAPSSRNSFNIDTVQAAAYEKLYALMDREAEIAKRDFGNNLPALIPAGDQSLVYKEGGFFRAHTDDSVWDNGLNKWVQNQHLRQFTALLYLNSQGAGETNFQGGSLRLNNIVDSNNQLLDLVPSAGMFVMFPSHPWFMHEVLQVTKGMRICLTRWYTVWNSPEPFLE